MDTTSIDTSGEDFAALFEKSMAKMDRLKPGQCIETTIVSISGDSVFLELSGKSEGVMAASELLDKDGDLTANEGDSIKVYFLNAKNGEMRFTTKLGGDKVDNSAFAQAHEAGIPVEGTVVKEIKGGYEVRLGETRAFCPFSQMGLRRGEDPSTFIGKKLSFKIIEFKEGGRNILVSNRAILEEEKQETIEALKTKLSEGMTVKGTVVSLQDFGAFVDVDGFQALLPISEVSRERINDLSRVLSVGDEIEAEILRIDWQSQKMSLSLKALLADPWDEVSTNYPVGSSHTGTIARITDFGAFVSLESGLDGLLHVSEIRSDDNPKNPLAALKKGQKLSVVIKAVDSESRRISLRQAGSTAVDAAVDQYVERGSTAETYNPFAALLKDHAASDTKKGKKG